MLLPFLLAQEYEIGRGVTLSEKLHLGGYLSIDYESSNAVKQFRLDDVAVMAYGQLLPELSYFVELEATPFYQHNFTTKQEATDTTFHFERAYFDYSHSEILNIRIGKQITPIGYWNLEPINVLRDTTSNPLYSYKMFPKFLTGIDLNGFLNKDATLKYHLFGQKNGNLDGTTLNIKAEQYFGFALENELNQEISYGGSLGSFITKDKKHTSFIQIDGKYDIYPLVIQMEGAYNDVKDTSLDIKSNKTAGYLQGIYHINIKHAIVGRYEYFHDSGESTTNNIGVLGYSYRPIYPVSLKGEVQYNSDEKQNKFLISLSVLF